MGRPSDVACVEWRGIWTPGVLISLVYGVGNLGLAIRSRVPTVEDWITKSAGSVTTGDISPGTVQTCGGDSICPLGVR